MSARARLTATLLLLAFGVACAHSREIQTAPADVMFAQARELSQEGRFLFWSTDNCEDAIRAYQKVIDTYPFSQYAVASQLGIADCYYSQGKWPEAIFQYRDFEKLHPSHPEIPRVLFMLGESYREQSLDYDRDTADLEQSYLYYSKAARADSEYSDEARRKAFDARRKLASRLLYIGRFYEREEQYLSAIERYEMVIRSFPEVPEAVTAWERAGDIFRRLGEEEKIEGLPRPRAEVQKGEGA